MPTPELMTERMKVVAYMRADGSEWSGYGSCRPGDVESFAVVRLSDAEAALQSALNDKEAEIERLRDDARRSADWCSEVRQDREMVASALQALLKDPLNPEMTEMAHLALGEQPNG